MRKHTPEDHPFQVAEYSTLPSSVLYALKYRRGMLDSRNVGPLFKTNLAHLGFYLLMKATDDNDHLQSELLQLAFERDFVYDQLPAAKINEALEHLAAQDPPQVNGVKLAGVSRAGFQTWNHRFSTRLRESVGEDDALFMVANAPYVGFHELAQNSLLRMKSLGVLKPSRFDQAELPVGFLLQAQGSGLDVRPLEHDFERPASAIVFDDVLHEGDVRQQVFDYWTGNGADQPRFITAVTVPTAM